MTKQLQIDQGTPAWHMWRAQLLGASDMAAIFGVSPYKTKRDLWFEKAGLGRPDDEDRSYIFARGHEAEAELRTLLSAYTNLEFDPACFEKDEIFGASLDGYHSSGVVMEAKLVGKDALKKAADGEIPEHHRIQVQDQLFVSEADKAFWIGRSPKTKGGVVVEIGRDEALIKQIESEGHAFHESLQSGNVPPLSLKDTLFITDEAHRMLFDRLIALKAQKERIDEEYAAIEADIKSLAVHPKVQCGPVVVTEIERSGSIDYAKIPEVKELSKDYLDSFRKKSTVYKSIRIKVEA